MKKMRLIVSIFVLYMVQPCLYGFEQQLNALQVQLNFFGTHLPKAIADRIVELKAIWDLQGKDATHRLIFDKMRKIWLAKKSDFAIYVVTAIMVNLPKMEPANARLVRQHLLQEFEQNFLPGSAEYADLVDFMIYNYLIEERGNAPEAVQELNRELHDPKNRWDALFDVGGTAVVNWKLLLIKGLALYVKHNSGLNSVVGAVEELRKKYAALRNISLFTDQDVGPIIQEFAADEALLVRHEIAISKLLSDVGKHIILWAISNNGKLYYIITPGKVETRNYFNMIGSNQLFCWDVLTGQAVALNGLPRDFKCIDCSCMVLDSENTLYKINLENATAVKTDVKIDKDDILFAANATGDVVVIQTMGVQVVRDTVAHSHRTLPKVFDAIAISDDGRVVAGGLSSTSARRLDTLYFFKDNTSSAQLIKPIKTDPSRVPWLALSDHGELVAFERSEGSMANFVSIESALRADDHSTQVLGKAPFVLCDGGKILFSLGYMSRFISSGLTLRFPVSSYAIGSSHGTWYSYISDNSIHVMKVSLSALAKLEQAMKSDGPNLAQSDILNLRNLYQFFNVTFDRYKFSIVLPPEWQAHAKSIFST